MRLLLVEDHVPLADELLVSLKGQGYAVDWLADGRDAAYQGASEPYDLIILDLGLPGKSGLEVLQEWRAGGLVTPVLVLTARGSWAERIEGLKAGADDYLTKPFALQELLARLRALLRRGTAGPEGPVVTTDHFTVDLAARQVSVDGAPVRLTPTEWSLLAELVRSPGRLVGQRQLLQSVWGPSYEKETNYLRVYLNQLRRKLEPDPAHPRYLRTEPGMGYRFTP
mgnify:CR=1 FL=1